MLPENRRLSGLCAVSALELALVSLMTFIGILVGWPSKVLDELPVLFWALYVPFTAIWGIVVLWMLVDSVLEFRNKAELRTSFLFRNLAYFVLGTLVLVGNLLMPTWNEARLLGVTVGLFLLLQSAIVIATSYLAKKRTTA